MTYYKRENDNQYQIEKESVSYAVSDDGTGRNKGNH